MKTNAPKAVTWWIGVILIVLGLLGRVIDFKDALDFINVYSFWATFAGGVVLALGSLIKGM